LTEKQRKIRTLNSKESEEKEYTGNNHVPEIVLKYMISMSTGAPNNKVYTNIIIALIERSG
jgi:hypothetical protein